MGFVDNRALIIEHCNSRGTAVTDGTEVRYGLLGIAEVHGHSFAEQQKLVKGAGDGGTRLVNGSYNGTTIAS
jgi:hypothetical protein